MAGTPISSRSGGGNSGAPGGVNDWIAWYDANDGVETSGGLVTAWRDQGVNAFDLEQPTAGSAPAFGARSINGITCLDFDGVDNFLFGPAAFCTLTASVFAVALSDTGASNRALVGCSPAGGLVLYQNTSTVLALEKMAVGQAEAMTATITAGVAFAVGMMLSSTTVWQYLNSNAVETEAHAMTPVSSAGGLWVGRYFGSAFWWDGLVGEIILYNRTVTTDEATAVMAALKAKWGTP